MFPLAFIWARLVQKNAAASGVALDALELAELQDPCINAKEGDQCDL